MVPPLSPIVTKVALYFITCWDKMKGWCFFLRTKVCILLWMTTFQNTCKLASPPLCICARVNRWGVGPWLVVACSSSVCFIFYSSSLLPDQGVVSLSVHVRCQGISQNGWEVAHTTRSPHLQTLIVRSLVFFFLHLFYAFTLHSAHSGLPRPVAHCSVAILGL